MSAMAVFFRDEDFEAQFLRSLGKVYWSAADAGECLAVAATVLDGDRASWQHAWSTAADSVADVATQARAAGHRRSAGEAFGRAAEYARQSYFFDRIDLTDPTMLSSWRRQREYFRAMLDLLDIRWELLAVPYENVELDGYLLLPQGAGPFPTLVVPSGYDAPIEEFWSLVAVPALRRGYAVAMYDGPGQGSALYEKVLYMRPDWEVVSRAVVGALRSRDTVDQRRLVSFGRSFGGYLAPRAAAGSVDFAACVADPGLHDLGAMMAHRMPPGLLAALQAGDPAACSGFDSAISADAGQRAFFLERAAVHGVDSPSAYVRVLADFVVPAQDIACPTLVTTQSGDAQAKSLFDALTCTKSLVTFTAVEGAGGHCEGAGQAIFAQRVFDWLDATLADFR